MAKDSLVKKLRNQSQQAFEELVSRYGARLYSVALRILRSPEDAEDAVQETFLKAYEALDSFREDSSIYTWLYRIVCNQSLMKLRKRGRREVVPIEPFLPRFEQGEHIEIVGDWSRMPDLEAEARELSEFFERCIDELPEDYRLPYILKDVEKLSEEQVCMVLGVTKSAMKNRVHRARLVIRKRIEDRFFRRGQPGTPRR